MIPLIHLSTVDSTLLEIRRLWDAVPGGPGPLAVLADEQTAGVGRQGRAWASPRGGMWFSLGWPVRLSASTYLALPLVAGNVLADLLEELYQLRSRLKWPNDLLVEGRKLAGILCRLYPSEGLLAMGIGLNANFRSEDLGDGLRLEPVTLLEALGRRIDTQVLARKLATRLAAAIDEFERSGLEPLLPVLRTRLAWLDEGVCVEESVAEGELTRRAGILRGLDATGRLQLEIDGSIRPIESGDVVHLRPLAAPTNPSAQASN